MVAWGWILEVWGKDYKGIQKNSISDEFVHYLDFADHFMGVYICQIIKLYTLNICNSLCVNYDSKDYRKKEKGRNERREGERAGEREGGKVGERKGRSEGGGEKGKEEEKKGK